MEQTTIDIAKIGIGKDEPQLEGKKVTINSFEVRPVVVNDKKVGDKVVFSCEHPDKHDNIVIIGIKYETKTQLKTSGIWLKLDKDNMIVFSSALATLMRYLKIKSIDEVKGKEIDTVTDEAGYLVFKAY